MIDWVDILKITIAHPSIMTLYNLYKPSIAKSPLETDLVAGKMRVALISVLIFAVAAQVSSKCAH